MPSRTNTEGSGLRAAAIRRRPLRSVAGALVIACTSVAAHADEFVDRVNAFFADIRESQRSDPMVLSAMAALESPPSAVDRPSRAILLPASAGAWSEVETWAMAAPQRAVLEVLDRVTADAGDRRAMAFGQPYGLAELGADPDQIALIQAGLYTDLGDPPLLSAARHLYLPTFDEAACLAHVEATRLLEAGDPEAALDVLIDWALFARQIADREFFAEKMWAFESMRTALVRVRDITYQDFRGDRRLSADQLKAAIDRLQDERGPVAIGRIQIARADFVASEQLVATVMEARGGIRTEIFASTMARLASTTRPLRLFGEAARWEGVAAGHANWFDTNDALTAIRSDYQFRWPRERIDPLLDQPFAVERFTGNEFVKNTFATIVRTLPDMRPMFDERFLLQVELVGTRHALGLVAFERENGAYPLDLSGIRPRFLEEIDADPFAPPAVAGRRAPLFFFVPIRDTANRYTDRQTVPPHEVTVLVPDAPNVALTLRDDQFVLYSVGADGARQWADEAQNTIDAPPGRDYLLWPPVLSIVRDTLMQGGRLN